MIRLLLALTRISGIGGAFVKKQITLFKGDVKDAIPLLCAANEKISADAISDNYEYADRVISRCTELGITILPIFDSSYPQRLLEMGTPPPVLFLKGNALLLQKPIVSIIGTRHSSELGNRIANRVGLHFSAKYPVCNGLVDGIDRNSIEYGGRVASYVIGVLSGGLNYQITSSKVTAMLAEQVLAKDGLIVSEVEPDKPEDQFSGSTSSRIQAGLSSAMILIQSSVDGGSQYTISQFAKLDRIFASIAYKGNQEYETSDTFSANRLFEKEKLSGMAKMCKMKTLRTLKVKELLVLNNSADYDKLEALMGRVDKQNLESIENSLF